MIVGIFLRYYKTYSGTHYIPLSSGSKFCGIVGNNGIGKSSILEALDAYINNKPWNVNSSFKRAGSDRPSPHVVPLYLVRKVDLPEKFHEKAELLNELVLGYNQKNPDVSVVPTTRNRVKTFEEHINKLKRNLDIQNYFLIPLGIEKEGMVSLSFLNSKSLVKLIGNSDVDLNLTSQELNDNFFDLMYHLRYKYEYIYIPKDIDSELFTKLETNEIQKLMGESLEQIISERISYETINRINGGLTKFIDDLENELADYGYRTSGERQSRIKRKDVYKLIIEAFFNVRKLNKKQGDAWIEINNLSSGEKQRAIMDIAYGFLTNHRENGNNLIIAIDEPECSLHMSACFEQFEKLFSISKIVEQLVFTSHWYGYLPTVESGCTTAITANNGDHVFELYDLASYREEIRRKKDKSTSPGMPYDIKIKSVNDLIQSIISSCLADKPYNWLICEGSTEKIYLSHYLSELVRENRLRIVPVGGAKEVKKIFTHLETSYDEFRKDIKGKVFLLSDTDSEHVDYATPHMQHILCKRIVNVENKTRLVDISSNPKTPSTEIEDALNPVVFLNVLKTFASEYQIYDLLPDEESEINEDLPSYFAMDLNLTNKKRLDAFFNSEGIKYEFSKRYEGVCQEGDYQRPEWIGLIEKFFLEDKTVRFD